MAYSNGNLLSVTVTYYFGSVGVFETCPSRGDLVWRSAFTVNGSGPYDLSSF